jgi:GT2 family glycosyltransferase
MLPAISIVMPTWRGRKHLELSVPAVLATDYPHFEFIVVENGIADDTADFLHTIKDPRLTHYQIEENHGYAAGVNQGVKIAKHSFVAVICNDNQPNADWLKHLIETLYTAEKAGAVMSQTSLPGLNTQLRGTMNLWGRNIQFIDPRLNEQALPIFYPGGNAFIFDKRILALPFDPDYFTYGEDVYLGWRLNNLGYTSYYCHKSFVKSFDGGTTKRTPLKTAFLSERNRSLNLLLFPEILTILKLSPFWLMDWAINIILGKNKLAKIAVPFFLLTHLPSLHKKRKLLQNERKVNDQIALQFLSSDYHPRFPKRLIQFYLSLVGMDWLGAGLRE